MCSIEIPWLAICLAKVSQTFSLKSQSEWPLLHPNARLKFVISGGFIFTDSSIVSTQSLVGPAPTIVSSVIVSPNVIVTTFAEAFVVGRKFTLTIADYRSPLSIASGYISIYHLPFNSMSPL